MSTKDKERIEALERQVTSMQVTLAQLQIDVHMLKLINKVLTEANKRPPKISALSSQASTYKEMVAYLQVL